MRMAVMQPYFFPYLGHFSLIAAVDEWIVFDLSQYTPKSWMNRNRVLHPAGGPQWLSVPLARASIHMRTHEAVVADLLASRRSLHGRLAHYRHAPFYQAVTALIDRTFATDDRSLTRLNLRGLAEVCAYLAIPFRARIASALALDLPPMPGPGGWAPAICAALGATTYINPISGRALFDPAQFARLGITLLFLEPKPFAYPTGRLHFEPGLSIIDVLMWNTPEAVRAAIANFTLDRGSIEKLAPSGKGVGEGPDANNVSLPSVAL